MPGVGTGLGIGYPLNMTTINRGWSPLQIPGLMQWFAADRILGQSTATPLVTWSDLSGNNRNAQQLTPGARPIFNKDVRNGLPGVEFNGTQSMGFTAFNAQYFVAIGDWKVAGSYAGMVGGTSYIMMQSASMPEIAESFPGAVTLNGVQTPFFSGFPQMLMIEAEHAAPASSEILGGQIGGTGFNGTLFETMTFLNRPSPSDLARLRLYGKWKWGIVHPLPVRITSAISQNVSDSTCNITGLDSSLASLAVIQVSTYANTGLATITDNKGNTWIPLNPYGANPAGNIARGQLFYSKLTARGPGHDFTISGPVQLFPSAVIGLYANVHTVTDQTGFDSDTNYATAVKPGALTLPARRLMISATAHAEASGALVNITPAGTDFILNGFKPYGVGVNFGSSMAGKIQGESETVEDPSFNFSISSRVGGNVAIFVPGDLAAVASGDAEAYAAKLLNAGGTDIRANGELPYLKDFAQRLYAMIGRTDFFPLRSTQNMGAGVVAYSFLGKTGTLVGAPAWTADGLLSGVGGSKMTVQMLAGTGISVLSAQKHLNIDSLVHVYVNTAGGDFWGPYLGQGFYNQVGASFMVNAPIVVNQFYTFNAVTSTLRRNIGMNGTILSAQAGASVALAADTSEFIVDTAFASIHSFILATFQDITPTQMPLIHKLYRDTIGRGLGLP